MRYSATIADDDAHWQATAKGLPIALDANYSYADHVAQRVKAGESPDVIVGTLRRAGEWTVSTPTLYRYIDQGFIPGISNKDLWCKSKRPKRDYKPVRAARAPKGPSIERRPEIIDQRITFGHWEMDTVIGKSEGKGQTLLVLTERLTRYEIIAKLASKSMECVTRALRAIVSRFQDGVFRTLTVDNGGENLDYDSMSALVGEVYYCHPYTSCERGSNENQNKLIRRWYPKGQSLRNVTQADCDAVALWMNNMKRKILGYYSPAERFSQELEKLENLA